MKNQSKPQARNGKVKVAEHQAFVEFCAMPRVVRKKQFGYATLQEFGKAYGVDGGTLSRWQKPDSFWQEVAKTWRRWGKLKTPDVVLALLRNARERGAAPECKLWLDTFEGDDLIKRIEEIEKTLNQQNL